MCLICMKYRIIILIINIISLGEILLSYIANTSRTYACTRVHTHGERVHTHRRRRRTGYRYSLAPNHDGPLRWRQCLSLAIEINTGAGGPIPPEALGVFGVYKIIGELRRELVTGCTVSRYEQFKTSPETIEKELRPAVCENRQTDIRRIIV